MNKKMFRACYSVLDNFTETEVNEMVEVIKYYNDNCQNDKRAACLVHGCKDDTSAMNRKVAPYRDDDRTVKRYSLSANSAYSGPSSSTCSGCGRPL